MSTTYSSNNILNAVAAAAKSLDERKEEVNRLNVFPVPDGDTGTNMSLTIQSVVGNVAGLPIGATAAEVRKAVTTGALMGARGNSGVITSQILRGLCEGSQPFDTFDTESVAAAFAKAVEVAFQAVRKPVEGTILTVLRDAAAAAKNAAEAGLDTPEALDAIVAEAYASVQRTPDLLPVLKEHGVVDAGGFGLAIIFDAFTAALLGRAGTMVDELSFARGAHPKVEIEQVNDWEGSQFRYCNEFLVDSDSLDREEALNFLSTMGDCELCVGEVPKFKVHVHSDHPDKVLAYFLDHGQVSEVFIHNMQIQSAERTEKLAAEEAAERKPLGFVAVAAGEGNAAILKSLGVDVVVSGGQTMNPSTKDLLDAVGSVNADAVIILPNNSNIIMAANSAAELSETPCAVVPTKSVPQAFSALFCIDEDASLQTNVEEMTEAARAVKTGEVTWATRDSKDAAGNPIAEGDVIGIADGSIEAVDATIEGAVLTLLEKMEADEADTCTILAGEGYSDDDLEALVASVEEAFEDLEVDAQRGEQPLYPIIFSVE
ncbi:DAK2 domain-containing protein [Adlercreutzia mucosicola]|uniref:DAK2 domain-containing protein n=1 Tax=Adlercreutzia mucosicola TaxID=580026 RepID=A0A6N8JRJ0_9ACTN|nr:DAK2 domain-containing protein [Adlercreutzia mucosicola]MEB1812871.1 DAK2 domain-containing protein [Adlercreutzia mucosicola]MVX61777.1 DAK2 domain-containing protein [Adlercreutzia mucosicola]